MRNINGFDLLKYILSYFVIAIHCGLREYSTAWMMVAEMAVPIYFVISGFLMFRSIYGGDFTRYIKRLVKMYALYTVIYFPLTLYGVNDLSLGEAILSILRGTFIVGENFYSWPLWYLWALIGGAVIIKLLDKLKVSLEGCVILGFFLVLLARAMGALHPFAESLPSKADTELIKGYFDVFKTTRNALFTAIPYLSLGLLLRKYSSIFLAYKFVGLLIVATSLALAYIFRVPYASQLLALIIVLVALKTNLKDKSFYVPLRNLSTLIYFLHMYLVWVFEYFNTGMSFISQWSCVSIVITLLSLLLLFLSRKYSRLETFYA